MLALCADNDNEVGECNSIKEFVDNDTNAAAIDKILHAIGTVMPVAYEVTLETFKEESFYQDEAKKVKPKRELVKRELLCHKTDHRNLSNKKLKDMILLLNNFPLNYTEEKCIKEKHAEIKSTIEASLKGKIRC